MPDTKPKVIFLDRDGTINTDTGYVYRIEDWQFRPGVVKALKQLKEAQFKLALITNQSGIGHELYTESDMQRLHEYMQTELQKEGAELDVVAYCPHRRDGNCDCRKPGTGMASQIEQELGEIDYARSWTVGDKVADLMFGKKLGTRTVLIRSEYWADDELSEQPDLVVEELIDAVPAIMSK